MATQQKAEVVTRQKSEQEAEKNRKAEERRLARERAEAAIKAIMSTPSAYEEN